MSHHSPPTVFYRCFGLLESHWHGLVLLYPVTPPSLRSQGLSDGNALLLYLYHWTFSWASRASPSAPPLGRRPFWIGHENPGCPEHASSSSLVLQSERNSRSCQCPGLTIPQASSLKHPVPGAGPYVIRHRNMIAPWLPQAPPWCPQSSNSCCPTYLSMV